MKETKVQDLLPQETSLLKPEPDGISMEELMPWMRKSICSFQPCALYTPGLMDVRVFREDCSYTGKWVSHWSSVLLRTHHPWWKFWGRYVGFEVYCPYKLGLMGEVPVEKVLDRILQEDPSAFGKYKPLYYRLARGLTVRIH